MAKKRQADDGGAVQLGMFGDPQPPAADLSKPAKTATVKKVKPAPFVKGSETSRLAALSMEPTLTSLRGRVLDAFVAAGRDGLTCDEVEALPQLKRKDGRDLAHQTASARVNELACGQFIADSGRVRKTRSHRDAVVYVVASRKARPKAS